MLRVVNGRKVAMTKDEIAAFEASRPVPRVTVPQSVSMRQARLALLAVGLFDDVEDMMGGLIGPEARAAQIEWEYATEIHRNSPMLAMLAPMLGLTSDDLDNLFRAAEGL